MATHRNVADYETLVGDLHDLRAFALASDLRSLTATAKLMGESKATVSRRITRLESALGVELLRRTPRTVEPTDDGVAYRARVKEILELLGDANAEVRGAHASPSGQLRLTAPPGMECVLPGLLARFARECPDVVVSVQVTPRVVDLDAEHVDVALRATARLPDSSFVAHRLTGLDLDMIAVGSPAYLQEHPAPRRLEDLAHHRIVHPSEGQTSATIRMKRLDTGEEHEVRIRAAITASDMSFAKELVAAGAGIGVLPRVTVQHAVKEGRLSQVLPMFAAPGAGLYVVYRGGRFLPPKVRAFRDFVMQAFGAAPIRPRRAAR